MRDYNLLLRRGSFEGKWIQNEFISWILWGGAFVLNVISLSSLDHHIEKNGWLIVSPVSLELISAFVVFLYLFYREFMRDEANSFIANYVNLKNAILFYYGLAIVGLLYCFHPDSVVGFQNSGTHYLIELVFFLSLVSFGFINNVQGYSKLFAISALLLYLYSIVLDVVQGGQFTNVIGRAAGFAENPNTGAYSLVILIILSVDWRKYKSIDGILWLMTALGVLATLSRGGIIIFSLAFVSYLGFIFAGLRKNKSKFLLNVAITLIASIFIIQIGSGLMRQSVMFETVTGQNRWDRVMEMFNGNTESITSDSRMELFSSYTELIADSPFFGHGTGYSNSLPNGPHNMYLLIWTDYGLVGLLVLIYGIANLLFFFISQKNRAGFVFMLVFIVEGFFNHNLLTFRPLVVALALLTVSCLKIGSVNGERVQTKS
ncbi:MAG: hypothetical protein K0R28_41 [Paenibacillus sp.]|jgi:O-antigen ligase|nr:hypothetical protein [Paenibacillus sp.]